ncbi:MAG: LysR family transcriptional regulator [Alphaproteobacteria bacterium]|jgi:DNA-binding transcriptional LysR family regulator|nr:LysR family transcriptional regulator [Alphaproteobacteria bacterium]
MSLSRRDLPATPTLQAFEAVARLGSFTAAAQELALTQSAVSRQVATLERQLGVTLLQRGGREVVPTPEGVDYASAVRGALGQLQRAALALRASPNQLTLAILPTFGTRWLMPRMPRFLRNNPDITVHFTTRIGQIDLGADGIDAAIHAGRADWPGAESTLLLEDRVQPCGVPTLGPLTPAQIARSPRLALASRPSEWAAWCAAQGLSESGAPPMVFEHLSTLAQACIAGLGVALLPPFLFKPELERGEVMGLAPAWANGAGYWLMTPKAGRPNPATDAFRDWLLTEVTRGDGAFA